MSASALFQIDPATTVYQTAGVAQNVSSAGGTVNCKLASVSGVRTVTWTIIGTHGIASPTITKSGTPNGQIGTFTVAAGYAQAIGIRCDVNGGVDITGDAATTAVSAVYVLDRAGKRPFFFGETTERDSTYGVVPDLNSRLFPAPMIPFGPVIVSTTNATPATAATIATTTDKVILVKAWAAYRQDSGTNTGGFERNGTFKNVSDVVSQVSTTGSVYTGQSSTGALDFSEPGDATIDVRVTGVAATNLEWLVWGWYAEHS